MTACICDFFNRMVNFDKMTQTNRKTHAERKIRIVRSTEGSFHMKEARFQWQERPGKWVDFDWKADKELWEHWKAGKKQMKKKTNT